MTIAILVQNTGMIMVAIITMARAATIMPLVLPTSGA
ncbi:hypothetical protein DFR37_101730 [Eoetvoesiella caeni]|uniref:Uncharacterized protein n=1 Tax=Eoetvoesiella caeni TaxID=645616 RepID=A0A366HMB8_9BURK|nr:hypothetical protein DFR37_101730 [Eoetvoesiella caeni]